jgi:branched-chain amino acid aminotransferase
MLREMGVPVAERRIAIDEVFEAHAAGRLEGAAGVGTAATIAPLGRLRHKEHELTVPPMTPDSPLARVGAALDAIRTGHAPDPHGWMMAV